MIKGIVFNVLSIVTVGIGPLLAALWCLWDREHQCLWDKMASTYVAWSPQGFRPLTVNEQSMYSGIYRSAAGM